MFDRVLGALVALALCVLIVCTVIACMMMLWAWCAK